MEFDLKPGTFRALIFDCDGTLVETMPAHVAALQATLAPMGICPSLEWAQARGLYGSTPPKVLLAIEEQYGPIGAPYEEVLRAWATNYPAQLHLLQQIAPVCEAARQFHGAVPMAVASNNQRKVVEATLAAAGLRDLFGWIVASEDVKQGKPAPDLFLEAARRMNVSPEDCIVFEDSAEGVEAAERAGMRVIRIDSHPT